MAAPLGLEPTQLGFFVPIFAFKRGENLPKKSGFKCSFYHSIIREKIT